MDLFHILLNAIPMDRKVSIENEKVFTDSFFSARVCHTAQPRGAGCG